MSTWIEQRANVPKRKRAGLVCVVCHERKIKCDLQTRDGAGYKSCSNCITNGQECRLRASKRGNRGKQNPLPDQASAPEIQSQSMNELENALCTPPRSTATNDTIILEYSQPSAIDRANDSYSTFSNTNNYQFPTLALNHEEAHITSHFAKGPSPNGSWSISSPNSGRNKASETYLGESGFLQVYTQEHREYTSGQEPGPRGQSLSLDLPGPDLQQSFTETYFKYCYPFCPVLDRETLASDLERSPLLVNALALAGSHIQPPRISPTNPSTHYSRAKQMFYNDEETDPITCLQSIALFYWWSPRPSAQAQRDAAWWWSALGVRQAQQVGIHREPKLGHPDNSGIDRGLRRRIWWTLFVSDPATSLDMILINQQARERLTAICQSRPCLIDPEDCNIPQPTLEDFPDPTNPKAKVFIYWVRLCAIIGRVAKYRSRVTDVASLAFPSHLANELIDWVQSLPQHLKLPIEGHSTTNFNRDVHQLHLPYLAVIIILHLSPSPQPLPRAYASAVMAASCVARIFKDYLARGGIRFLMPVCGWICGIATLALLRASRLEQLTRHAEEDIKILVVALKELRVFYPVADMFLQGFKRLRNENAAGVDDDDFYTSGSDPTASISNGVDWLSYFPHMTTQTSGLASVLLAEHNGAPFLGEAWLGSMPLQLEDVFGSFENFPDLFQPSQAAN
jgi:Fungal specific transcription factor domain/Fungal Zn(2)-Cys(6) binuclear cluster domain